jgi:hypothetical protein
MNIPSLMTWRCPACSTQIQHGANELELRLGALYRCHVCRLELVIDLNTNKLIVPPIESAPDPLPSTRRSSKR